MVLKIIGNNTVYVYKDIDRTFFRTRSAGGMMYLQFDISVKHKLYKYIQEETRLLYDGQRYIVKGINERTKAKTTTINAELDLTGLECEVFGDEKIETKPFRTFCNKILANTGWTVVDASLVSKRTTTDLTGKTPRKLLEEATNLTSYRACYRFETLSKEIHCIKPYNNTTPIGVYFTDELNLSDVSFKGSSSGLITRLYPFGKDGLTIESVNNGCKYIENFAYTNDVIADTWRDERYTNAQSLYDDAVAKLEAASYPDRSYTCKIIDLAKIHPEIYGDHLSFDLYDIVTLVDRNRQTRVDHRIVEIKEYPLDHTLDTVTLSSVAGRVIGKIQTLQSRLTELDAQTLHDRTKVNEIKQDLDTTVLHVSESWASNLQETWFTQTSEGLFLETTKMLGSTKWSTLLEQSYNAVRISWNNSSRFISFEPSGEMKIYDSPYAKAQENPKLRAMFDYEGVKYYYGDNKKVGKIGTNAWHNNDNYRGLVFDLENDAGYMCWAAKDTANGTYNVKLAYYHMDRYETQIVSGQSRSVLAQKKGLFFCTNTYANGNLFLDDTYNIAKYNGGGVGYAGPFSFGTRSSNGSGGYNYTNQVTFNGRSFTVYNNTSVNFYSNINMNGYSINNQSDIRIKQNIAPTQINGLEVLNSIDMKEFEWCGTGDYVPIGIIAQQLEVEAPELVETDNVAGLKSIKTSNLIYYAIKAIQELSSQIEQLQAGTYAGTTYTKAALDLTKEAQWAHHYAGDPVGASGDSEIVSQPVSLPTENQESENNDSEEEE